MSSTCRSATASPPSSPANTARSAALRRARAESTVASPVSSSRWPRFISSGSRRTIETWPGSGTSRSFARRTSSSPTSRAICWVATWRTTCSSSRRRASRVRTSTGCWTPRSSLFSPGPSAIPWPVIWRSWCGAAGLPAPRECPICGRAFDSLGRAGALLPNDGDALICLDCAGGEGARGATVGTDVLEFLRRTGRQGIAELAESTTREGTLREVEGLTAKLRRRFLGRELRSYDVIRQAQRSAGPAERG